ncbi:MAG: 50S ribosomal protein L22 [Leptospiraceae bacterium]|nr:50S ribosomal protein L22 [Leptospiraceae bacterium]
MEAKATAKFLLISPRKARLVADEIRGFSYSEAIDTLQFVPRKASGLLLKLLNSARANAKQANDGIADDQLFVKKLYVDEGPTLKRFKARARGRGMRILKRTSHITVVLADS